MCSIATFLVTGINRKTIFHNIGHNHVTKICKLLTLFHLLFDIGRKAPVVLP